MANLAPTTRVLLTSSVTNMNLTQNRCNSLRHRCICKKSANQHPTLAELLKPLGYTSGQFGKNHLGDKDEFLPTNHGFDEFFGNLYDLNAEEEPENYDYPKSPDFKKHWSPRRHSFLCQCRWTQRVEDTGPPQASE